MSYRDTYFRLNWPFLNDQGLSKYQGTVTIDKDGCEFIKGISCVYSLSIIMYMASFNENSIINADDMYSHFFDDSRANLFYFDSIIERLIEAEIILKIE